MQRKGIGVMIAVGPKPLGTPGQKPAPQEAEPEESQEPGNSVGPDDVDYSDNDLCETCANMGDDGTCQKYGFPVEKTGHCEAGYDPKDSGDQGGVNGAYGGDYHGYGDQQDDSQDSR